MKITVAIPVGPYPAHAFWLDECLESVRAQTRQADEILLIDDMHGLEGRLAGGLDDCRVWKSPWRLGVAHALNFGVALAQHELVFMLGADDTLEPECLELCLVTYAQTPDPEQAYFFVGVRYMDDRPEKEQFIACGAAMVSKTLWRRCGGFPPETASGAPDAALISTMMVHAAAGRTVGVSRGKSLYNYRPHAGSDTAQRGPWQGVILSTRDMLTSQWQPPNWGRM